MERISWSTFCKPACYHSGRRGEGDAEGKGSEAGASQVVETAAVKGQGLRELEEALLLQAEVMELKASRGRPAEGVVLEARLDKGQGPRATLLLRRGTLTPGQVPPVSAPSLRLDTHALSFCVRACM